MPCSCGCEEGISCSSAFVVLSGHLGVAEQFQSLKSDLNIPHAKCMPSPKPTCACIHTCAHAYTHTHTHTHNHQYMLKTGLAAIHKKDGES